MSLSVIAATRYETPLKEGGSLPGVMMANDGSRYVVKFIGAGQGRPVLVAEVIVAALAGALGIRVPRLAAIELPADIARYEADEEVQDLLNASVGLNLAVEYLPGAFGYDGSAPATQAQAETILWLDAFTANIDRTWNNPNLMVHDGGLVAIDHGAALYFHHAWPSKAPDAERFAAQPFDSRAHVLRDLAPELPHEMLAEQLTDSTLQRAIAAVPDQWLTLTDQLTSAEHVRATYLEHLQARLTSTAWLPGATP